MYRMHHRRKRDDFLDESHLASGGSGGNALLPGLFVLLAFLEKSLRDFNCLTKGEESAILVGFWDMA